MSGDLIRAAKLWAKVSAKTGRTYMVGRWGGCRVLIFENDKDGEGEPTHWLMIGAVEEGQERDPARRPGAKSANLAGSDPGGGQGRDGAENRNFRDLGRDAPAKASAPAVERGPGWRGPSTYRRGNGAQRAPAGDHAPFYDDTLEDIGR